MDNILIIEDNQTMLLGMQQTLKKAGYATAAYSSARHGINSLAQLTPACVITDLKMQELDGISVLKEIKQRLPDVPVMIITGFGTIEKAVEAMKLGAFDFITKPFPPELLRVKVKQAIEAVKLSRNHEKLFMENQYLRSEEQGRYSIHNLLLGSSSVMREVHGQIQKVARTPASVFISGESGTGKELVARAIHTHSLRHDKPFIKVNCSALAESLLESELFGHERGAFTGALKRKPGRFELADQGTLFLDEIGDIHHGIQLKLLRVLQEREFERVGGTSTLKVDVRIISATNQDLTAKVAKGLFREDLYYRLVILPIHVPPLRERFEDIPTLVDTFLRRLETKHRKGIKRIAPIVMQQLTQYPWPGNVRELENLMEQLYIFSESSTIELGNLPNFLKNQPQTAIMAKVADESLPGQLNRIERDLLVAALEKAGGVKTRVAKMLGIKTSALYYKLEKYGLLDATQKEAY